MKKIHKTALFRQEKEARNSSYVILRHFKHLQD